MAKQENGTLVIDNFRGVLTNFSDGDINSGRCYAENASGQNPVRLPGNLTWSELPVQIDEDSSVITDLILAGKERVESGILYVYCIGHTGRLYKIQVNNPATYNPDYDNPVLLATLAINSPTFTRGGFIDFFGATEQIYIGHDMGVTRINFDGTSEGFVGVLGSWTQTVPRPLKQFLGNLYIGNGTNIAEVNSTAAVSSYTKLSPAFPTQTQVRDLDVSVDGNYLQAVVTRLALGDITSSAQDTTISSSSESFIFKWNGTDIGYTAFTTFPSFSLSANTMFQNYQYVFGTDQFGMAVFNPSEKIISWTEAVPVMPNAITSTGNIVYFLTPLYYAGVMEIDCVMWGSVDFEVGQPVGFSDVFFLTAKAPETDIIRSPFFMTVANAGLGASSNGYVDNIFSESKFYFSTLETSSSTTAYRFYKWSPNASYVIPSGDIIPGAVYQTQTQLFSKKVKVNEVRIYGEPWVAGNSFSIDLVGSSGYQGVTGTAIPGGNKTFTAGTNLTIGDDFAWYTPDMAPTYGIGVAITNEGDVNHVINKIEIDYTSGGK